jgi:hypothetical protein
MMSPVTPHLSSFLHESVDPLSVDESRVAHEKDRGRSALYQGVDKGPSLGDTEPASRAVAQAPWIAGPSAVGSL